MTNITKSLTQILLTLFEETYFLIPLSKQNCLINIHECIMFLNRKPCILKLFFSFWKNSVECVLSRFHYVYNRCLQLYYHIHLIYLVTYSFWMQKRRGTKKVEQVDTSSHFTCNTSKGTLTIIFLLRTLRENAFLKMFSLKCNE